MSRVGLIRNPRSLRNRGKAADFRRDAERWLGDRFAEPASQAELQAALQGFLDQEVDLLAIDGGDGTVRDVLSAAPEIFGARLPRIAILPSGNTNLIQLDVGSIGRGRQALAFLRAQESGPPNAPRVTSRPLLQASWNDGSRPPLRGFFLGAVAYTRGIALAHNAATYKKVAHGAGVALGLAGALISALGGPARRQWLAGHPLALTLDGQAAPAGDRFLFLATTLERLLLGIWPFWNAGLGPIRYLDISARPERLLSAGWCMLRGKAPAWLLASPDYRSGSAMGIDMRLDHPFVLDGETFEPGAGGVRLTAGPVLDFVAAGRS